MVMVAGNSCPRGSELGGRGPLWILVSKELQSSPRWGGGGVHFGWKPRLGAHLSCLDQVGSATTENKQ